MKKITGILEIMRNSEPSYVQVEKRRLSVIAASIKSYLIMKETSKPIRIRDNPNANFSLFARTVVSE